MQHVVERYLHEQGLKFGHRQLLGVHLHGDIPIRIKHFSARIAAAGQSSGC
jgi:hypothetical protein